MGKELFDNIPSKVSDLLSDVKNGRIGLPDLQRPFVWKDNKVRELLDSMMKGYPIGYIMLWSSPDDYENTGHIGKNEKVYKRPDDLVIDGQQRLTALLAAMYGVTIKARYVRAGADELFCGYVPFSWSEKYGTVLPLNRREVLNYNVQIGSFSELEILANMVQKYQKPVHLAFNSLYYRPEQYEEITQIIQQCRSIGFDSYILADPALLVYLRKEKIDCEVHLSGDLGTVNSAMTEVFAKEYPKRIIFQRKNTISEMRAVIRHITAQKEAARKEWTYPTEFEAFALNELCQFSGAFCNSLHCDEMGYLCRVPYWKKPMSLSESKLEKQEKNRPGENISISEWDSASELTNPVSEDGYLCGATGCGLCTLKQLSDAGITHLKLVGRGNYTDFMERDIRNLRRTLEILEDSSTEEEYIRAMKAELFPNGCSHMCYAR